MVFVAQSCGEKPAISLLLFKGTFSQANRLVREAKPSGAEFNVLIKMLKRPHSRTAEAVIALSL